MTTAQVSSAHRSIEFARSSAVLWAIVAQCCAIAATPGCGRIGYDAEGDTGDGRLTGADGATVDSVPANCSGLLVEASESTQNQPNGVFRHPVDIDNVGCTFSVVLEGAGGGRGNHGTSNNNDADGGAGGSVHFDFSPGTTGVFEIVLGGGGSGEVVDPYTLDDPFPGAGGGGASMIAFVPDDGAVVVLAIAGGGGGGGWGRAGTPGGGGNGECAPNGGGGGGCNGVGGFAANGGRRGGDCPTDGTGTPIPCAGPGGAGNMGTAGFGLGLGHGADVTGNHGSGGGGGGFGGGGDGGFQGGHGAGGGSYVSPLVTFSGGSIGGANNGARHAESLALAGGDGAVTITAQE